jgi:hypothetical protein
MPITVVDLPAYDRVCRKQAAAGLARTPYVEVSVGVAEEGEVGVSVGVGEPVGVGESVGVGEGDAEWVRVGAGDEDGGSDGEDEAEAEAVGSVTVPGGVGRGDFDGVTCPGDVVGGARKLAGPGVA